ncbi:3-phosphoshikimate 1-carboxyvinyltransferase [Anaerolinea thermolimosa]|uniref:3-phosphoshikimate 1-carboxyvinyltransferase n=1 Tax=Anaerolinea thermolimosa TaxID=229919 RepID=UPI000A028A73|nr:3-phosphoshikimate 1-carboxyvinyltransferase [Anaerolinea thermolimosa]GAP08024.1 3-phosphoshikimate 1-carboxyvinyltransferase [Anaerolinea thermolimosa]
MNLTIFPGGPLRGCVESPGDKSLSHRVALFAALAEGESCVEHFLVSGVTEAMLRSLKALGVAWELSDDTLRVYGRGLHGLRAPESVLDCGNSATTMRLLTGAVAAAGIAAVLDGSAGLRRRPMERIAEPLRQMGVDITTAEGGGAPLTLGSRPPSRRLSALDYSLPVASAQVKTCLLLAALAADAPTTLHEPALSRDHTERMLRGMGVEVETSPELAGYRVTLTPPKTPLCPLRGMLPGDFSAAAFLMAAALITPGSELTLPGVGLNPTRTGLLDAFRAMGGDIEVSNLREYLGEPVGDLKVRFSPLRGVEIAGEWVVRMIDEFPAFAAAAVFAEGPSVVRDAQELRYKESDRIGALCSELRAVGAQVEETPDGFILQGGGVRGGVVNPHGDHRLAMSLAVVGLASREPVKVLGAEITRESFPGFPDVLRSLGAQMTEAYE